MSDSKNQRQSVLMRSSLRLNEKEDLFGLITAEMHAELPDSAIRLRIYPTTHKILTKFLPQLPKKNNFKGGPAIPRPLLTHVREAMKARNTLAHKGEFNWNDEKLDAVLSSFNDLLLMFDVYAGQKWASELISYETFKLLR